MHVLRGMAEGGSSLAPDVRHPRACFARAQRRARTHARTHAERDRQRQRDTHVLPRSIHMSADMIFSLQGDSRDSLKV